MMFKDASVAFKVASVGECRTLTAHDHWQNALALATLGLISIEH
jgi:hypothetical protein